MKQLKAIIAAGTLTGIVLVTAIAFGVRSLNASGPAQNAGSTTIVETVTTQPDDNLQTMVDREAELRQQIEDANQTILDLQAQQSYGNEEHEDEEEEHEYEYEEEYDDD